MEKQRLQHLIDKVLSGRASVQEQQELDEWYAMQGQEKGLTNELSGEKKQALGKQLFQNIEGRLQEEQEQEATAAPVYELPARSYSKWMVAAAVLVLLAAGGFYFFNQKPAAPQVAAAVWAQYNTTSDVEEIHLPDQSTVWLNAGSSIRFDTAFTSGKREIWLEGEAYFDVAHLEGRPFEVHTGRITTRVLGTAFNIDAYDLFKDITVTVRRGKVSVSDSTKELGQLLPDQRIICRADGSFQQDTIAAGDYMAWSGGQLVFRDMQFREVAKRLERKFGVTFVFRNADIADCPVTASFEATVQLKDILEMIALTNGSSITRDGNSNQYIITGTKKCK